MDIAVEALARLGIPNYKIAEKIGVSEDTLYQWCHDFPSFSESLKRGKKQQNDLVTSALLQRATGYEHEAVKIVVVAGVVTEVPYIEHYPPDTNAIKFWLTNRDKENWKTEPDNTGGPDGKPPLRIIIDKDIDPEKDDTVEIHLSKDENESEPD